MPALVLCAVVSTAAIAGDAFASGADRTAPGDRAGAPADRRVEAGGLDGA